MKRTRISDILIVLGLVIFFGVHQKSLAAVGDSTIFIQNPKMVVGIGLKGGQLVDVHLKSNPVNPLTWQMAKDQMRRFTHEDAQYKGHFLCIGNIGNPSVPEIFQGLVMRGEQTGKIWSFVRENDRTLVMGSSSPSDGIEIARKLKMHESESRFLVVESFTNTTGQRRATNILQHATIGPPFLNENTLINTNAGKGFSSKYEHPDPYAYEYVFPYAVMDTISSDTVDLRIASPALNYVSKHIFDPEEDYGWVTAYDPHTGVLLGYVWRVDHYPWLNLWNASR